MKKTLLTIIGLCLLALGSQPSDAAVFVTISANGASASCDNGKMGRFPGCSSGFVTTAHSNVITFSGSVGGYTISNLTIIANVPGNNDLGVVTASIAAVTHTSGAGELTVDVGGYNFTLPNGPALLLRASATTSWIVTTPFDFWAMQAVARPDNVPMHEFGIFTVLMASSPSSELIAEAEATQSQFNVLFTRQATPSALTGRRRIHQVIGTSAGYQHAIAAVP